MLRLASLARATLASILVLALVLAIVAASSDVTTLLLSGVGARNVLASASADLALAGFCAMAAGPVWALLIAGLSRARASRSSLARLWPLGVALAGFAVALLGTDGLYRPHTTPYVIYAAGFGALLTALALVATLRRAHLRELLLLGTGGAALIADMALPELLNREVHDVVALLALTAILTASEGMRRRLAANGLGRLSALLVALLAVAVGIVRVVDTAAPGWRALSWQRASWQPRLGRTLRALVDFDGDGYSPVAWGGDCDDFDSSRNPAGHDHDGIDANCNGVVKPLHPSDGDRGLAQPTGDPDEPADAIDRVILVTIDSMRQDTLVAAITPRLAALAESGIELTHTYSAGSSTLRSLGLLQRASDGALPVGQRLLNAGIATAMIFSYHDQRLEAAVLPGYAEVQVPNESEVRWSSREVTDRAIAHMTAATRRELLWLHYFDAHYPVMPASDVSAIAPPAGRNAEYGRYLTSLATIDRDLGRLCDWLLDTGRWRRTILIITADHGESFGEHGIGYHGLGGYEAVLRVPGIVVGGDLAPLRYSHVTSHRDLPATILGGFGLVTKDPSVELFGRSWLRLRRAASAPLHRFVVSRSELGDAENLSMPIAAIAEDDWKLIVTFGNGLEELYRPAADPHEADDLLAQFPDQAHRLERELALFRDIDGFP